ncbi:hypothetical protein [Lysinibacillus xylanilyticus]|nr:hypothetical protein [Lysinibacillus xylanilyticus]
MQRNEKEYIQQLKASKKSKLKLTVIETDNLNKFDGDLQELLEGLE